MLRDKSLLLYSLQIIVVAALVLAGMEQEPQAVLMWGLLAAFLAITGCLFAMRFQYNARLKTIIADLGRANTGNLNTRLLAKDEPLFNEIIFAINLLIEQWSREQVLSIQSEAARKSLLSSISHDIRTPLTSIVGYVDALKDDIAASEVEKQAYVEILSNKAGALKGLIDELFHMVKLDADEIPMKPEALDLAEIARETLIEFLPLLNKYDIALEADVPDEKCWIVADRISLLRIIGNLLKNAVQHGRDGKVLGITLTAGKSDYQLHVWDKGAGIVEADRLKVFQRMYRGDHSRNPQSGGSGLGLAIAQALAHKNEAEIAVESEPGIKTTFTLTIKKAAQLRMN
ncbi:Sensor histidine kinase RcsC [Paenibacillus plantiphilus]|uniref:histidine kinase n=1 Tax=Paenibacillus plantiphilus TaxID=2905650 RepID=A0ABN8GKI1_9BACL|nr:HAMP domain-containing sensor histidine kinase [Paenibacillus plantiphilus]CAH1208845.1 Sensor histidine kinase RcsC [Paenibacillus plantiphilus]